MAAFDKSIVHTAALVTTILQVGGFLAAYALQTEVFYDIFGGLNFLSLAALGYTTLTSTRQIAFTILFVMSRGWLLVFLAWRAHHRKGDSRFDGVKDKFGMFFVFWMVQGFWVFLISWPLLVVQALPDQQQQLTDYDKLTLAGMAIGVITEILADIQKTHWVNQGRKGGFCTVGLWKFSRHPNYFGEILQWWCAWLFSYGSLQELDDGTIDSGAFVFWAAGMVSPIFTMAILLSMSGTGIWAAEGKNLKRYYESEHGEAYKEYRESTSPLIPLVGYKYLPMGLKRELLFEWERFEYRPTNSTEAPTEKKEK